MFPTLGARRSPTGRASPRPRAYRAASTDCGGARRARSAASDRMRRGDSSRPSFGLSGLSRRTATDFLTGYYEPCVPASRSATALFCWPILARPTDLVTFLPGAAPPGFPRASAARGAERRRSCALSRSRDDRARSDATRSSGFAMRSRHFSSRSRVRRRSNFRIGGRRGSPMTAATDFLTRRSAGS